MANWPNYSKNHNLDKNYATNYKLICEQLSSVAGANKLDKELCPTFFGFLENINRRGEDLFKNHDIWSDFIEWSYKKQTDLNVFTNWNLEKFVSSIEYLINKNVTPILGNAEVLNKSNERLRNVMKLHYLLENIGDIKTLIDANHDDKYPSYCHFINDCLDIYKVYSSEVCSAHWPAETRPNNICNLFKEFEDKYASVLYPAIEYRKILIEKYGEGIFGHRLQCKVHQREYGSRPIESFFAKPKPGVISSFNNYLTISFSVLGSLMFFFILYKLTPIKSLFGSEKEERRRRWRNSLADHRGPYGANYREQFGSEFGTDFGSESISDFTTESGTDYGSESVSDFRTESGTDYGSESVSDFRTESGTLYGGRQGSSYGGDSEDDRSSRMS
ncbi:variable surface protein Vir, putative [Plasmodium vivax]|uniref:Variable surface protein Vir, putative n=1 Tax=Plasmodium vivax (strain Salvador I) TaxID=126793 RepID=A5KCM7_PLAVS|nr:variable surface protein Vir, putative [Plasmodium vivax]EDL42899.1 variable surface protein Vir, putative [Plasmodium vivax]|eukprot:XP_001612673.1 variable surface protein Vir [Plasmodium vivax Sal-1]